MIASVSSFTPGLQVESKAASVSVAEPCGRLSLRARGDLKPFASKLGAPLPGRIGERAVADDVQVICLGPDEWMIHAPADQIPEIEAAFQSLYERHPHSLVDVSGREVSFTIDGPRAAELLSVGCPRDLGRFKPSEGRRTVFDGVTVILWCDSETTFRMDVWHSFAPYVFHLLETGCRELGAESGF